MKWIYIEDIAGHKNQDIEVRGWVYNKRSSGKVRFLPSVTERGSSRRRSSRQKRSIPCSEYSIP